MTKWSNDQINDKMLNDKMLNIMKTYMAPATEMTNLAANGIMQSLTIMTGSNSDFTDYTEID